MKVKEKREHRETYGGSRASSPAGRGGGFLGGAEVFTFSSLYLTEWKKWIVYTKYKLNCHKVYRVFRHMFYMENELYTSKSGQGVAN